MLVLIDGGSVGRGRSGAYEIVFGGGRRLEKGAVDVSDKGTWSRGGCLGGEERRIERGNGKSGRAGSRASGEVGGELEARREPEPVGAKKKVEPPGARPPSRSGGE